MKKFITTLLCASMLFGSPAVLADTSSTENTTLWNYRLIENGSEHLYEAFPFTVEKVMKQNMGMDLYFQYLKNVNDEIDVNVQITDLSDNSVILSKTLERNSSVAYLADVPNGKTYLVEVTENVNNESTTYTRYVETKYVKADFPINITLDDNMIQNNNGETFTNVMYKKVETTPPVEDENGEIQREQVNVVTPENINALYSTLDENSYYELQMVASLGTAENHYQGFISTYQNGEDDGIFTRGYELRSSLEAPSTYLIQPRQSIKGELPPEYITSAEDYELYMNDYIDFTYTPIKVYRYIPPETGR